MATGTSQVQNTGTPAFGGSSPAFGSMSPGAPSMDQLAALFANSGQQAQPQPQGGQVVPQLPQIMAPQRPTFAPPPRRPLPLPQPAALSPAAPARVKAIDMR